MTQNNNPLEDAALESKRSKKKLPVVIGVLLGVVVLAGAGFFVWHEQPSFCNAICHTPMDPYLPTYEAEPGEAAVDKWGNEVEDASAMLAAVHRTNSAEATCMSCHVPTLSEQVSEGISWVTGGYSLLENDVFGAVLEEASLEDLTAARGVDEESFCLNEACHVNDDGTVMTMSDLAKITDGTDHNPHEPHNAVQCSDCHKAHRSSVLICTTCHGNMEIPEGWLSASEAAQLN